MSEGYDQEAILRKALHAYNLLRFAAGAEQPIIGPVKATWEVTFKCNMQCKHCHLWQVKEHDDLSTEEAKKLISDLRGMGTLHLSFSGGEPFLRDDMFELIEFAVSRGMTTAANTNGSRIATPEKAKMVCDSGLGSAFISLDGPNADMHNALRGRESAFDLAIKAIDNIIAQRPGKTPRVFINTTVNRDNVDQLEQIIALAREHGVDGMTMSVIQDMGKYAPEDAVNLSGAELNGFSKRLRELVDDSDGFIPHSHDYVDNFQTYLENPNSLYKYRCAAGYATTLIHPNGDVYPCVIPFARMGNLRERSFYEIWNSPEAREIRKKIKCNQHPICWFDCIAPISIFLHNVRKMRIDKILDRKVLSHILKKV